MASLSDAERTIMHYTWPYHARDEQLPPEGDWLYFLILAGRGFGKLLEVSTPIPTPNGWKSIVNIVDGDELFDEAGKICRVIKAHHPQYVDEYKLTFSDGAEICAGEDHQWVTWTHADRKAFLRSAYEADTSRFPADWPNWRVRRSQNTRSPEHLTTLILASQDVAAGMGVKQAATHHGICRTSLYRYLREGFGNIQPAIVPDGQGPRVRTTREIIDTLTQGKRGDTNHCIPTCGPLALPSKDLPIAPYTLGLWLGDGDSATAQITTADYEVLSYVESDGYAIGRFRPAGVNMAVSARIEGLHRPLRLMGLLKNKHIPVAYLRASIPQRLALLRGLLDSDGTVQGSHVAFCSTNKSLADGVYELAVSLGQKPVITEGRAMLYGKDCGAKWHVAWRATVAPFALRRKAALVKAGGAQSLRNHHRMIVSVQPTGRKVWMRCLTVDSPNSMFLAGRAMIPTHNTRTLSEWVRERKNHCGRIAIVAETAADARDVIVDGQSGLIACAPLWDRPLFEPSKRRITWNNGAYATLYSGEDPEQLRGPQHSAAAVDELCKYRYGQELWDQLKFGLRIPPTDGRPPQCIIATTPKPSPLIKNIINHPRTITYVRSTYDNLDNLDPAFIEELKRTYEGTSLGQQEIHAAILDEAKGALWTMGIIEASRVREEPADGFWRLTGIGVDPATVLKRAETGIVAVSKGGDGHGYVRRDASGRYSPPEWGHRVVALFEELDADFVVAEGNQGGEMVRHTIHTINKNIPVKIVHARQSKQARAEPISMLWEQGRMHMVGGFPTLESQMVTWEPESGDPSPDRIDAMVWVSREMFVTAPKPQGLAVPYTTPL